MVKGRDEMEADSSRHAMALIGVRACEAMLADPSLAVQFGVPPPVRQITLEEALAHVGQIEAEEAAVVAAVQAEKPHLPEHKQRRVIERRLSRRYEARSRAAWREHERTETDG
ncbi:MAG: hypothetical protein ACO1SX_25645 [Actinomycetota bacterium]